MIMKRLSIILLVSLALTAGCKKDEVVRTSGTDTIENTIYKSSTYYAYGFSFSKAAKVATTESPGPDIVLYVASDTQPPRLTFQANNLLDSFSKYGEFADASTASQVFNSITTLPSVTWTGIADPISVNQIWIYRTTGEQYAKIRIISVVNETRNNLPYGECTFEWVFQPDGSTTFPGK
jgi:hypothetical protein